MRTSDNIVVAVASGKGGTGKTTIATNLALSLAGMGRKVQYLDCDVEEPNGHIFLKPNIEKTQAVTVDVPEVDLKKCTGCGQCEEVCNFRAVFFDSPANDVVEKTYTIDPISCEGCGVCVHFCPNDAIEFKDVVNGQWFISDTRFGTMVHARLGIAQENSGKLVSLIRKEAKRIAEEEKKDLIIVDGSPGIGCPVIASIAGADLVLIVTEPTLSGKHDLGRVADLAAAFNIPVLIATNKFDLNPDMAAQIEEDARKRTIRVVGKIRYDKAFTKAQIMKCSVVEYTDGAVSQDVKALWRNVKNAF